MGRVPGRTGRAALAALAFLLAPVPAAAQTLDSPHALFKSSLNGAQIVISGGIDPSTFTNRQAALPSNYSILDWPDSGAGSLSIDSVTLNQPEDKVTLTLAYTGDFTTDRSIRILVSEFITTNYLNVTLSAIPVYAADPSLVVGSVSGTVTEGGGQATFPVKLRTGPTGTVSVAVTSRDATEGSVSPSSLSFTTSNWNTSQTVTVTGLDDAATDGDVDWDVRLDPSSTADSQYNGLSNVDVAMTTVDDDGGPVVSSVTIASTPASGDTYEAGEAIEVRVGFDQSVAVTGIPRLALTIGTGTRPADYASGDGTTTLTFRYTVEADAADTDGIGIGANALTLNGGRIRQSGGTASASLGLGANTITNSASHKVDGSRGPPAVAGVSVGSPEVGDTFERGETIEATVTFNKAVDVTGTPRLALTIGTETRQAGYASGDGSTALTFRYTVVAADADTNGISIAANALTLNNGTIRRVGSSTVNAVLNVGGQAVSDSASHKVAGGTFTVPRITRYQVVSSPMSRSTQLITTEVSAYGLGEVIELVVTFSRPVEVTGTPLLLIGVGHSGNRNARYAGGTGTTSLEFQYTVAANDVDDNGISASNAPTLNSGAINDARVASQAANLSLAPEVALNTQSGQRVDGRVVSTPAVTGVALDPPPKGDSFEGGEPIEVAVTFSRAVNVTGTPRLALTIGTRTRQASFASGSGTRTLTFRYTVQAADADADGISIGASALALNGGTITLVGDATRNAALGLGTHAIADSTGHKVDGSVGAPRVVGVSIASPSTDDTFGRGEVIEVTVTFHQAVAVTGTPQLALTIGTGTRQASYARGTGTTALVFSYTVVQADADTGGLGIAADALALNSGTITLDGSTATNAALGLGVYAIADSANHKVDGSLGPPEITAVALNSPVVGDTFERGETIVATVTFNRKVDVTGAPRLALTIGSATRQASYATGTRTTALTFRYEVVQADADTDGLSIAAGALTLNNGTIRLAGHGTINAGLGLGAQAITDSTNHKVAGGTFTAAAVSGVSITSTPAGAMTYVLGETIEVEVRFSRAVSVTGTPRLALGIGTETRQAAYASGASTAQVLSFTYEVGAGDADSNGLSIAATALALNGGGIDDARDAAAPASLGLGANAVADSANHRVDGSLGPPGVSAVALGSPAVGDTFERGETIVATVTFNKAVDVTGTPRLALSIGAQTRQAGYASGDGSTALTFRYTVVAGDADPGGVSIAADALTLNGGTIRQAGSSTVNAVLGLGTRAVTDSVSHKVDGARVTPRAAIGSTSPSPLAEGNLDGATVTVTLANTTFESGVTAASFELVTAIPNVSVSQVSSVGSGDTTATLTLAFSGGFSRVETLAVKVLAGAHSGSEDLTTGTVTVIPPPGLVVSPQTSTTSRLRTGEDGTSATFTVALTTEPVGNVVVGVTSSDTAQGTVDTDSIMNGLQSTLTFTTSNWNTAQTVTLTGVDDSPGTADGSQTYAVTLTVDQAGTADARYDALSAVTVYAVNDDDEYGLAVGSVTGQATEAGGQSTFEVALQTRPMAAVSVSVSSLDAGEGRVSPSSMTFSTSSWNTAQTVTVTGEDDADHDGTVTWQVRLDPASEGSGGDSNYHGLANVDVDVTTTDDDTLTAELSLSPASIAESGSSNTSAVSAVLSRPSGSATTLTVTAVSGAFTVPSGAAGRIEIAAGDTTSTGTVTITAVDNDTDAPDRTETVTATAVNDTGSGVASVTGATLTITDDDDPPDVTLSLSAASVSEMGGTSDVSAVLSRPSSAVTTVTVTGVSGAYTVSSTPADRRIVIAAGDTTSTDTVTVTAVDNDVDEPNRTPTVTATMANGQGTGSVTGVTLTLTDDDATPTVELSASPGSISENGGTSAISAELSGKSSEATTVTVTAAVGAAYSVASGAGATIVLAAGATTSADTVTVTAVNNDVDAADNAVTVTGTAANGHGVGAVTGASLTITDDDTAGLAVAPATSTTSRLRTTEAGGTAEFTVALTSEPTGNVSVSVTSSDTAQGTVSASSLTFTASDWNTEQTVTLTGVDDNPGTADGSQTYTVTLTSSSTVDAPYNGLAQVTVYAINLDDELGLDVGAVTGQATEAGGTATFTVALLTQPSEAVTVAVTSRDSSEGRVSPSSMTFGTSSWNVNQTVTVTGLNDDVDDGDVAWAVRLDPSSGDADYNAASVGLDVSVTTTDDDTAALTVSPTPSSTSRLRTTEGGGQAAFTVRLATEPVGNVVLDVASALTAEGTVSPAMLTFTASDWATAQTVTLTGADDEVDDGDRDYTATLTVNQGSTADSVYDALALVTVYATNADDDEAGVTVSPQTSTTSRLRTGEDGAQATFTVQLDSEPTGDVVLDVASSDTDEGTVDTDPDTTGAQDTLTFTASSWNSAQTVTVTGVDDAATDGPQDYTVTLVVDQADTADANYDELSTVTVYLVNDDDDATPDVNGDGDVDYQDALLMYYTYTAPILADSEFGPELRRILFRNLRGSRSDDAAGYLALLTAADDWKATAAGDLNLDGDVDYQDALLMYYTYTAPILGDSEFGPELRRILFMNLRGSRDDDTAGYLAILDAAKALVTAYGSS